MSQIGKKYCPRREGLLYSGYQTSMVMIQYVALWYGDTGWQLLPRRADRFSLPLLGDPDCSGSLATHGKVERDPGLT